MTQRGELDMKFYNGKLHGTKENFAIFEVLKEARIA
jgi:hypothetical protein